MNKGFYLVLPSNSCPQTQPNNVANRFVVDYENPIQLIGSNWEVALTEFSCVYSAVSVGGVSKIMYQSKHKKTLPFSFAYIDQTVKMISDDKNLSITLDKYLRISYSKPFTLSFNVEQYFTVFGIDIKKSLTAPGVVEHVIIGNQMATIEEYYFVSGDLVFDEYITKDSQYHFSEDLVFNNVNEIQEYFSSNCSSLFKQMTVDLNHRINFVMHDNVSKMTMDKIVSNLLGFLDQNFDNKHHQQFVAENKPKLKASFDHLYIYSSIVESIHVGNVLVPLLKNIWLENKNEYTYGDIVYQSLDQPMYLPVAANNINKIEVNIRDDAGKFIIFSKGSKTNLTLHFRKYE